MKWSYTYDTASDQVGRILIQENIATPQTPNFVTRLTRDQAYDVVGRLDMVKNYQASGTSPVISSRYQYDQMNRRRQNVSADEMSWGYQYDDKGQVTSAKRYFPGMTNVSGQQFEFSYDNIGNRMVAKRGGDGNGNGLRAETYTANGLNQYTTKAWSGTIDVVGVAYAKDPVTSLVPDVTVQLNGLSPVVANRQGEYFHLPVTLAGLTGPRSNQIQVIVSGATTPVKGSVYVPDTTQAFSHDEDGNLRDDDLWVYSWDSENRLKSVESMPGLNGTALRYKLEFSYDYRGRRYRKKVSTRTDDSSCPFGKSA
jgi:hypothetical protein